MPDPIVYINSWPGVGKHTIAKEMEKQMNGRARLVHNHLHIDLAGAILPRSSTDYLPLRRQLRSVLFNTLATSPETFRHTYIFTDFQTTTESSVSCEYVKAAKRRGCLFIPINLECRLVENEERMQSPERLELVTMGKGMLLDTKVLEEFRKKERIHKFESEYELEMDVTEMLPAQAAQKILAHLESVVQVAKEAIE